MSQHMEKLSTAQAIFEPTVSSHVHDMRTPLVAIKSSLNCTKDIFSQLIHTYKLACENGLVEQDLDISFLKKIDKSFERSINEIFVLNYHLSKLHDEFTGNVSAFLKKEEASFGKLIFDAIKFHELRVENCTNKFRVDKNINDFYIKTDKTLLEKAILYLLDNLLKISAPNIQSKIFINLQGEGKEKDRCVILVSDVSDFSFLEYIFNPAPPKNNLNIGAGMHFVKEVIKKSGWTLLHRRINSIYSIQICFKSIEDSNEH